MVIHWYNGSLSDFAMILDNINSDFLLVQIIKSLLKYWIYCLNFRITSGQYNKKIGYVSQEMVSNVIVS